MVDKFPDEEKAEILEALVNVLRTDEEQTGVPDTRPGEQAQKVTVSNQAVEAVEEEEPVNTIPSQSRPIPDERQLNKDKRKDELNEDFFIMPTPDEVPDEYLVMDWLNEGERPIGEDSSGALMAGLTASGQESPGDGSDAQESPGGGSDAQESPGGGSDAQESPGGGSDAQESPGGGRDPQESPEQFTANGDSFKKIIPSDPGNSQQQGVQATVDKVLKAVALAKIIDEFFQPPGVNKAAVEMIEKATGTK